MNNTDALVTHSTFTGNSARRQTGAVGSYGDSDVTLIGCDFVGNSASGGGAVVALDEGRLTAVHCRFFGNSGSDAPVSDNAGGAALAIDSALVTLLQCLFVDNSMGAMGGAVGADAKSELHALGCTFVGNSAATGTVASATNGSIVTLRNCIGVGTGAAPTHQDDEVSLVLVSYGLFGSAVEGAGNIVGDPLFVRLPSDGGDGWADDPATPDLDEAANNDYGDLRLLPGSPAIDAGDALALPADTFDLDADGDTTEPLPLDIAGNPRVVDDPATPDTGIGGPLDLGAYEYQPSAACPGDCDANGAVNLDDIGCFVDGFLGQTPEGDCDGDGLWTLDDIECFVMGFLAGCP